MIKFILTAASVNYDVFLDNIFKMAKEHPEQLGGAKLPPFSDKMIKMLPADKKNAMLAQAVAANKDKVMPQAEMMLSRFLGSVRLADMDILYEKNSENMMTLMLEMSELDHRHFIYNLMPFYYNEFTAPAMLGETYTGSYSLSDVQNYMMQQSSKNCQFLIAKSISVNKQTILQAIENGAGNSGIDMKLNNMRIMVK